MEEENEEMTDNIDEFAQDTETYRKPLSSSLASPFKLELDENGLPKMQIEKNEGDIEGEQIVHRQPTRNNDSNIVEESFTASSAKKNTPVTMLITTAAKKDVSVQPEITLQLIDKSLFNVIKENYKDSEEEMLDAMIASMDITDLRNKIKECLKSHYEEVSNS